MNISFKPAATSIAFAKSTFIYRVLMPLDNVKQYQHDCKSNRTYRFVASPAVSEFGPSVIPFMSLKTAGIHGGRQHEQ